VRVRRTHRFEDFRAVSRLLEPGPAGLRVMLADLKVHWGTPNACAMINCPVMSWDDWITGRFTPSKASRRAVWCAWCFTFHPDRLHQFQDWLTWGRVRQRPMPRPGRFVEDYQI
jgi:hypothetical protein